MNKIKIVAKFEIVRQLKKPSFWIALLLVPLGIFGVMALSSLNGYNTGASIENGTNLAGKNVGITSETDIYGDIGELIVESTTVDEKTKEELEKNGEEIPEPAVIFEVETKADGLKMIISNELDVYYYFPADFSETHTAEIYYTASAEGIFTDYGMPLTNIVKNQSIQKLSQDDMIAVLGEIQYKTMAINNKGEEENLLGKAIIPLAVLGIFYILICVFGNRLVSALAEEKENRISEMILTAVSAKELVIGKIISLISLGFIQIAVFIIPIIAAIIIYRNEPMVAMVFEMVSVDPWLLISNILLLLVSYFFYAGSCTLISSLMPTARDASNYFGVVMMGTILPLLFMSEFISGGTSALSYILSFFPLSAPLALMLRNAFGALPTWELVIGIVELAVCSAGVLMLTVKSFQKNAINFSIAKLNFKPRKTWKR